MFYANTLFLICWTASETIYKIILYRSASKFKISNLILFAADFFFVVCPSINLYFLYINNNTRRPAWKSPFLQHPVFKWNNHSAILSYEQWIFNMLIFKDKKRPKLFITFYDVFSFFCLKSMVYRIVQSEKLRNFIF